ncbi:MAG: hypothetical protein GY757_39470 [bacterium]|nr:hypothetical protein [bacterium]
MNGRKISFLLSIALFLVWGSVNLGAVVVSTVGELTTAVSNANSNGDKEIVLTNGTYGT